MRRIFADADYWVAIANRKDQWYAKVVTVMRSLGPGHARYHGGSARRVPGPLQRPRACPAEPRDGNRDAASIDRDGNRETASIEKPRN